MQRLRRPLMPGSPSFNPKYFYRNIHFQRGVSCQRVARLTGCQFFCQILFDFNDHRRSGSRTADQQNIQFQAIMPLDLSAGIEHQSRSRSIPSNSLFFLEEPSLFTGTKNRTYHDVDNRDHDRYRDYDQFSHGQVRADTTQVPSSWPKSRLKFLTVVHQMACVLVPSVEHG